jgi:hypothetical protein
MSLVTLLALAVSCPQAPEVPAPSGAGRLDVVELRNGERLEGRILAEVGGYVEILLPGGGVVGFGQGQLERVLRNAGGEAAPAPPRPRSGPPEQWFVLHDGRGRAVGWLCSTVQVAPDGSVRLGEEWEFAAGRRRTAVTMVETAGPDLSPISSYYRERVGDEGERHLVEERIVEARFEDGRLRVQRLSLADRSERQLSLPPGTLFPLVAMARLRAGQVEGQSSVLLFDPVTEELCQRTFEPARARVVALEGGPGEVQEIATASATGRNAEWLDGSLRTLRREINGPSLVALPSTKESAKGAAAGGVQFASALVVEPQRRFGLWLPNPSWAADPDRSERGQLHVRNTTRDARASLVLLDHFAPDCQLTVAADAVERWLGLLHSDLRIVSRAEVRVRGRPAVRLDAGGGGSGGRVASVHVLEHRGAFLALTLAMPAQVEHELSTDLEFLLQNLELDPEAVDPPLQGPLRTAADSRTPVDIRRAPATAR